MTLRVGLLQRSDREALHALRVAAYREAGEFHWKDETLLDWSAADDHGMVLGLWNHEGALVSSVRASVFTSVAAAERFLEYSLAGVPVAVPALVLSRAATDPQHAGRARLALLRYAYLSPLPASRIGSAVAIVFEGGPRLRSMADAGFEFHEPHSGWDSEVIARTPSLVALLPRSRFAGAVAQLHSTLGAQLDEVQIDAPAIAARLEQLLNRSGPRSA